jgi:TRAP-type transport system periplasmic protein
MFRLATVSLGLFASVACASIVSQSNAQSFSKRGFRVGIGLSAQHPQGRAVQYFSDRLSERTNGQWKVTLHASGSLGNDVSMIGELQKGKLDFSAPDTSTLSRFEPGFSLINLPFEFSSEQDATRSLDGKFGTQLLTNLEAHGLVGLGYWENGFRHVTNSKRPLRSANDFKELRVRVMQNPVFIDAFQGLGAKTVPLPFPELFAALKSQGVDAQENPPITILSERFFEVQRYMTLTRHSYSAWALLMSKQVWDTLNENERKALREVSNEARDFERNLIRAESKNAIESLKSKGMDVQELSRVEASRVRMLVAERIDGHKKKIDRKWRDLLYLERLNDVLIDLSAANQTAPRNPQETATISRKQ